MHVGFQKRQADFPHGNVHVSVGKFAAFAQLVKKLGKSSCQCLEQVISSLKSNCPKAERF
jgi:hypothetical protein